MKQLLTHNAYPVSRVCAVPNVSRSGYYEWLGRPECARSQLDERLKVSIRAIHQASRQSYGTRRVHGELRAQGQTVGRDRVARLRRQMGLQSLQRRCWRISTTEVYCQFRTVVVNVLALSQGCWRRSKFDPPC